MPEWGSCWISYWPGMRSCAVICAFWYSSVHGVFARRGLTLLECMFMLSEWTWFCSTSCAVFRWRYCLPVWCVPDAAPSLAATLH